MPQAFGSPQSLGWSLKDKNRAWGFVTATLPKSPKWPTPPRAPCERPFSEQARQSQSQPRGGTRKPPETSKPRPTGAHFSASKLPTAAGPVPPPHTHPHPQSHACTGSPSSEGSSLGAAGWDEVWRSGSVDTLLKEAFCLQRPLGWSAPALSWDPVGVSLQVCSPPSLQGPSGLLYFSWIVKGRGRE